MRKLFYSTLIGTTILSIGTTVHAQKKSYFDKTNMDSSINPADDFFMYANGNWIKNAKIPDDQYSWGSFTTLYEENLKKLRAIVEETSLKKHPKGSIQQKVGDYYKSGMDTITLEKMGYDPLKPVLQKIDALRNYKELLLFIAENYYKSGIDLLGFSVGTDEKNSTKNIATLSQTALTLPEKDYYFRADAKTNEQRKKMVAFATQLFTLVGIDLNTAQKNATDVLNIETAIAKSHLSQVELRDPIKNYNKISLNDLQKQSPHIDWSKLFSIMNVKVDSLNIAQPKYIAYLDTLLITQPISVWKNKLKFDYIAGNAGVLSKVFRNTQFEFDKIFSGQTVQQERWKTMINSTDSKLGDLLSQLYVHKYFPPTAKKRMDELVNNLQHAFQLRIEKLDWMSATTKQHAQEKLNTFLKKIGYPTKWKNIDGVTIDPTHFFVNRERLALHKYKKMIEKLSKSTDKTEWFMTPSTVNAYYNPNFNEIVFPAAILQFPFFDLDADDAINYGAIGMVIGHEMTHGFDDQGRQYDKDGNLKNWWQAADAEKFTTKSKTVIHQYNQYKVLDSLKVNGELTLGENLADIGGLAIAYDAFKMTQQGQSQEKIDGFTPDQRFFLSLAQIWRSIERPELSRLLINTDPHSPSIYRVNGALSNFEPFYKAFNITEKNKLFRQPADRAKIW